MGRAPGPCAQVLGAGSGPQPGALCRCWNSSQPAKLHNNCRFSIYALFCFQLFSSAYSAGIMCYSLLAYCFSILIPFLAVNPFSTLFQGKQQPPPIAAAGLRPKAGQRLPSCRAGAVQGPWHQEVLALQTVTVETPPQVLMRLGQLVSQVLLSRGGLWLPECLAVVVP